MRNNAYLCMKNLKTFTSGKGFEREMSMYRHEHSDDESENEEEESLINLIFV